MPLPALMIALQACKAEKQVLMLMREIQTPEKDINDMIQKVKSDLGPLLPKLGLKKPKVIVYGSAVNGLFTFGSDLDIFIHPGQAINKEQAAKLVRKLGDLLKEHKKNGKPCFSDIVTMTNGRIPVVKFLHIGLKREININFTSHTGVNNSYLIKHLITLDARIRPMMVMLKIYFRSIKAAANLTTFNLYSLIIFALQNNAEPVLPPLMDFLKQDDKVLFENRWPVRFDCKPFQSRNKQTLMGLILDFCSFYADFDFANRLVSPYCGNAVQVTKDSYQEILDFECAEHQFTFNRQMNIQDFFVLCCNVGSDCAAFQEICKVHQAHLKEYAATKDAFQLMNAFFTRKTNTSV